MLKGESLVGKYLQSLIFFHLLANTSVSVIICCIQISNRAIYCIGTRHGYKFHVPNVYLSKYYYHGIKVFNNLQPTIKNLSDINVLEPTLKECLLPHSFCCVQDFSTNSQLL